MSDERHLFGLPGAEHMQFDLATVYEQWVDDGGASPGPDDEVTIEEWTVRPIEDHLPHIDSLMDWLVESASDEMDEDGAECWESAARCEDVTLAFAEAMALLASKVTYRMADKCIAVHVIAHDANGEPRVNGVRLFPPRQG